MLSTRQAKEVIVRMPNEIGALDRMVKAVAERGVNLLATSAWVEGPDAVIRFVTDDNLRAVDTLVALGLQPREVDVLVADLAHKPGMLHHVTSRLAAAGIDVHHLYATASIPQDQCFVVFSTANNDTAMVVLNAARPA